MVLEKRKKFIINFMFILIWAALGYVIVKFGLPALTPFVLAAVLAYLLKKPIIFMKEKLRISRKLAAILVVLIFYCTIGLVVSLFSIRAISEIASLVVHVPRLYNLHVSPLVKNLMENIEVSIIRMDPTLVLALEEMLQEFTQSIGEILSGLSVDVMAAVSSLTSSLPGVFIQIVLMIISTFFIAVDYDKIYGFVFAQLNEKARTTLLEIKEYVVGTLFVCIRSYALIMFLTFVELSIGLSILKLENAVLTALIIAIFDILPVLGTGGIMIPWAVINVLLGNYSLALGLGIVYVVITIIRNIIEPKIVGKQIGLHPVLTLASMFLGVQMFGAIGLFGFPIGLSLLRHLNEKGVIRILKFPEKH